ncbi:MAG TPA: ABC transporter permease, partial [Tepidisphaeraceae bacterium]|nr:ABC transporter permease [Tepidisphaeraceae bacterium]
MIIHMGVPINYNIRNLVERKGTTLMTAVGIALTVAVLVTALAMTAGLASVFASSGDPKQFLVLRKGTNAELTSTVSSDSYQIIRRLSGIAISKDGEPMVSPEGLTVVNLPSVDSPEGMNVTIRGLLPIGLSMRNYAVTQGRMFDPGLRQIVVGEAIARRYPDARIGKQIRFGRGLWEVVGVFHAGDSAANSEIWSDLNQLRGDFEQQGGSSSLLVRAESESGIAQLAKQIADDQRLGSEVISEKQYYADMTSSGAPLQVLGFSVAVIMAIGSAFAATNTMYAAVARRSREIGTLRAIGFGRGAILRSFMLESICLALIGGIIGVLIALPINGLTTAVGSFSTFAEVAFN